jgi:hypothetical protein
MEETAEHFCKLFLLTDPRLFDEIIKVCVRLQIYDILSKSLVPMALGC